MKRFNIFLACILVLGLIGGVLPVSAASENLYPENLFSSAEVCGQYFHNAAEVGTVYEEVDGEYVMTMPIHRGLNYLYSKEAVPYDSFTVTFDYYLIIDPNSHFQEMDFLFGMSGEAKPFHQASVVCTGGSLMVKHYTLEEEWAEFKEDETFFELYEEEFWMTFTAEITPDEVTIYVDDFEVATLSNSEGCVGANGYIGIRAGSSGGWKIKNLKVTEGVGGEETSEPTEEPTQTPTQEPTVDITEEPVPDATNTPELNETPTIEVDSHPAPSLNPTPEETAGFPWLIVGIVVAVVVIGGGIALLLVFKKKK